MTQTQTHRHRCIVLYPTREGEKLSLYIGEKRGVEAAGGRQ
jgi:hypothetical protein